MFEAYKVGIRLTLVSNVASGLAAMSRQFVATGAQARALQAELNKIKALALAGGAVTGVGLFGLHMMDKALQPAKEYAHQLNVMNTAGLTHLEQVRAINSAWQNTRTVMTTTATENLRSILDLRNVLGNMDEALMALPIVSRIQAVLAASTEGTVSGHSRDLAFSMAKALDIIGAARNPAEFQSQALAMARVITATQGRVTPEAYQSVFKYARQAKFGLSDEFKYEILPSLMLEMAGSGGGGGGSRGVGPMLAAFYRLTNQGFINKKSVPLLEQLGLISAGDAMSTSTTGTMVSHLRGSALAAANPFQWVQQVLLPAIYGRYGRNLSQQQLQQVINDVFRGNQLGANMALEFALKPGNFLRDQGLIRRAMPVGAAFDAAMSKDPNTVERALGAQWKNLKVSFMMGVVPVLLPVLRELTSIFANLGQILRDHPALTKALVIGLTGLFAAMGLVIGPLLLLKAAFGALSLAVPMLTGTLTTLGSSMAMLGKIGMSLAALYIGYQIGDWINTHLITPLVQKITGDDRGSLGTGIYDMFHTTPDMHRRFDHGILVGSATGVYSGAPSYGASAVPPHDNSKQVVVHTQINMDGRKVAQVVTHHQVKSLRGPNSGNQGIRPQDDYIPPDMQSAGVPP